MPTPDTTTNTPTEGADDFQKEFDRRAAERAARESGTAPAADALGEDKEAEAKAAADKAAADKATADAAAADAKAKADAAAAAAPQEPAYIALLPEEHRASARGTWKAAQDAEKVRADHAALTEKFGRQSTQVAAYERRHQEMLRATTATPAKDAKATGDTSAAAGAASSVDMEKFKKQFPDIHAAMEARISEVRAVVDAVTKQIDPLAKDHAEQLRQAGAAAITAAHPGWENVARNAEFKGWFSKQAASLQALANSEAPEDTIMVFDLFKAKNSAFAWPGAKPADSTSASATDAAAKAAAAAAAKSAADAEAVKLAAKRKQQLDDAVGAQGRPQSTTTTDAPDDFAAAFEFFAAKRAREAAVASR